MFWTHFFLFVCVYPETPEYEAKDIGVRVMSPKSVLISWVDPAVEMGKVSPGVDRCEFMGFCYSPCVRE